MAKRDINDLLLDSTIKQIDELLKPDFAKLYSPEFKNSLEKFSAELRAVQTGTAAMDETRFEYLKYLYFDGDLIFIGPYAAEKELLGNDIFNKLRAVTANKSAIMRALIDLCQFHGMTLAV